MEPLKKRERKRERVREREREREREFITVRTVREHELWKVRGRERYLYIREGSLNLEEY